MQLIVLGMHRSGTSVLARFLNMMGAYFGPEGIGTGANQENPKGFWERKDVRALNDMVLHSVDCDWDQVASFDLAKVSNQIITEFRTQASKIVLEMDAHRPWLLKEPRLCLLFPLWRELLEVPVCIHIDRNPLEVAKSIYTRNEIPIHVGVALWEKYNLSALAASGGLPRLLVSHRELMQDPIAAVNNLYLELVENGVQGLRKPSPKEVTSFVSKELYHERTSEEDLVEYLNGKQIKLFESLVNSSEMLESKTAFRPSKGAICSLEQYEAGLRQNEDERLAAKDELKQRLEEKESELMQVFNKKYLDREEELVQIYNKKSSNREKELIEEFNGKLAKREKEIKSTKQLADELRSEIDTYRELRNQEQKHTEDILSTQSNIIAQLIEGINALIYSRPWKIGSALASLVKYKLLFRSVPPLPSDYLATVINRYESLKKQGRFDSKEILTDKNKPVAIESDTKSKNQSAVGCLVRPCSVDVVVCVHNALEDVKRCIKSISENTPQQHKLFIVNDGSDSETTVYLRNLAENKKHIHLIENEMAQGYTKAANLGLRASSSDYVILLNSDTVVPRLWVNSLIECAESDPKIGIVGPLSNAASWQSVPNRFDEKGDWAVQELPNNFNVNEMAELVYQLSEKEYPRVSFVNGFCFAIKRAVIEAIGYLDEKSFPKGYGEENDYCLRAIDAGFDLAIADQGYVYHAKSKSYSHSRRLVLSKEGGESLKRKHGAEIISAGTKALKENRKLENTRRRIQSYLKDDPSELVLKKYNLRILFVMPVRGGGGGAHSVVQELVGMRELGVDAKIATFRKFSDGFKINYPELFEQGESFLFFNDESELKKMVVEFDIVVATLYSTPAMLDPILYGNPNILSAYYVQDYEPWFFEKGTERWQIAHDSYSCVNDMVLFAKTEWLCRIVSEKHNRTVYKVSPSLDHRIYYPSQISRSDKKTVVISAMVRPSSPRRAPVNTVKVLGRIENKYGKKVSIVIFGCGSEELKRIEKDNANSIVLNYSFENRGVLTRDGVADVLRESAVFVDFSDYQAFGRTGLEAMACGCAVILPSVGGLFEYAVHEENSLIVDTSSINSMTMAINRLVEDDALRTCMQQQGINTAKKYSIKRASLSELSLLRYVKYQKDAGIGLLKMAIWPCVLGKSTEPTGSAYIRLLKPLGYPSLRDKLKLDVVHSIDELRAKATDICVIQRHAVKEPELAKAITQYCDSSGIKLVHEIDDDLFNMQHSAHKGLPEEEYGALAIIAKAADRVVTSSPLLQNELKSINPKVICVPNAHDENLWLKRNGKSFALPKIHCKDSKIRVLYMGTRTHLMDLQVIRDAWIKIEREYGQRVVLEIVGGAQVSELEFGQPYGDYININYPGFVNWLRAQRRWHIGVIPLADTDFNRRKSYIKYLDYAALGVPIICSDIEPYREVARNGENSLIVRNTTEAWYQALKQLIDQDGLRDRLAQAAFNDLTKYYCLQQRAGEYFRAYQGVLED